MHFLIAKTRHFTVAKQTAFLLLALLSVLCLFQVPKSVHCKRHTVAIDTKATPEGSGGVSDFVATEDWRVVSPGQRIPPGLHVRMNIQTGHTEARLMPPSSEADSAGSATSNLPALVANDNKDSAEDEAKEDNISGLSGDALREALSSRRMKEALKKIKAENLAATEGGNDGAVGDDSLSKQFRSYEDLKADFAKLNADIKTDLEVIKELLAEWQKSTADPANRIRILSELEYHLRQIDNAQNFVQLGGLELLMGQVNATVANGSESVGIGNKAAAAALRVLAASCQGNAPVQVAAIKAGFLPVLLRTMMAGSGVEQQTRSTSVLALSSLCRNFPLAQTVLLKSGGLAALRSAFESRDTDRARVLRIVTLLSDMVLEAAEAETHAASSSGSPAATERHRQYQQVSVARAIAETGWCSSVPRLLDFTDHDAVEKVVVAMSNLFNVCGGEFASITSIAALDELVSRYERLAKEELAEEGAAGYFDQMRQRIVLLRERLNDVGNSNANKTEL